MRNRIPLTGAVASLLQRIALDEERFEVPALPPVVGGSWGDVALDGLWGPLRAEGASLIWEPSAKDGSAADVAQKLERIDGFRNVPASLELADGRRVTARFGHTPMSGGRIGTTPGLTCEFTVWRTELCDVPARWVGRISGGGFLNRNLSVRSVSGTTRRSAIGMRLEGNYTWYLLLGKDKTDSRVVVDTAGGPLDHERLGLDFNALQVSLGCPLELEALVALDESGNVVGCAGVQLGGNRETRRTKRASESPVPDDVTDECWVPVFFRALAKAMGEDDDLPWGVAVNAYVDSVSDATIDGRYLKLHVALEAFAKALLKKEEKKSESRSLVKKRDEWVAWVKGHGEELATFVADGTNVGLFVNKVISAMNLPSSGVVADALSRLPPPLVVDAAALDELDKRNIPAHHFTMNRPKVDYDVDRDVQRVEILRSLLAALVARAREYDGALAGWVDDEATGWKTQADWWPPPSTAALGEARIAFVCEREHRPSRPPKVFRSRLRRGPQSKR